MPAELYEDCRDLLEEEWEDGDLTWLIIGADWCPGTLREVQDLLDDINAVLSPILHECKGYCKGEWYLSKPPFGVARWEWTDKGFHVVGTEL